MKIGNSTITLKWGDIVIWKHKSFEYQFEGPGFILDDPHSFWIECDLKWTRKRDHAGISFTFGVRRLFWMNLNIHDHRHWDRKNNKWQAHHND